MGLDMYLFTKGKRGKELVYWRKVNHIHAWFVANIQNNVDDCKEYHVSYAQLKKLKATCIKVLKNKSLAPILLPTQGGFFFGDLDYNDYYFKDLEETVEGINKIKKGTKNIYYQSSW